MQSSSWWRDLWQPFWAVPVACVVAALALGLVLPVAEEAIDVDLPYVFQGGPDGARSVLGDIAGGMISMTGLVFSITMVILQLASSQFSPRVLGNFLGNRITQWTFGVFTGTFVYALAVIRYVRGDYGETSAFVPQLGVTLAFLLVLASVGCFLAFIHHITSSIQVAQVISRIGDTTLALVERMYPEPADPDALEPGPTWSPMPGTPRVAVCTRRRHGRITHVDYDALVSYAREHDVVITIDRPVGQFLAEGQSLLRIWGVDSLPEEEIERLYDTVGLASERELRQDVAFGIRQLVDIATRALSSGVNDATTAVQVLDELHRVLRLLVARESPSPYIADPAGVVRIVHDPQSVEDLLELAVAEINHHGKDSLQVPTRIRAMLADLDEASAPRYRPAIARLTQRIDGPVEAT